jgi:hypothetical protein
VIGAGEAMIFDAFHDDVLVPVDDQRVTEPLGAAAHEVLVTESESTPAVLVILQTSVKT